MLGHRALTVQDYKFILKRRWWILAIPAIIFPIIAYGISFLIQPEYESQTLILVEQQKVPENYVKPVVTEDLNARLATMREQIESRAQLQPIIEKYNLFANTKLSMDDRIDMTRKNISIRPLTSDLARTGGLPGFYLAFRANDAKTAQLVCQEMTSKFSTAYRIDREGAIGGTSDFLKAQLADAKAKLDEQDSKLAKFQETYAGRLPEAENANMNMITSLNTQLDAATHALTQMEQDRTYTESMLSMQQASQSSQVEHGGVAPQERQAELQTLLTQEADLTSRYTDDYPDVLSVRRKIKELRAQMAAAPAPAPATAGSASTARPTDSLGVQQLRARLRAMDDSITAKRREESAIQGQLRSYQSKVASSPQIQEEYKSITRDSATAQAFYDDLLNKIHQSDMASNLEKRQQGETFKVMDEPNFPEAPSSPKRPVFAAGGLALGLGLGMLIVALLEYLDTAMRSERDVWAFTQLPTLGVIALNDETSSVKVKRGLFGRGKEEIAAGGKPLMNAGG